MTPGLPVQTEQGTALAFMNGGRVDPRSGLLCKQKLPHFDKALLKYFGGAASTLKFLRRVGVGICQPAAKAQLLSLLRVNFTSGSSQCEAECKSQQRTKEYHSKGGRHDQRLPFVINTTFTSSSAGKKSESPNSASPPIYQWVFSLSTFLC